MDNLEKNLSNLPKFQLSKKTDLKIKFKIRSFILLKNLQEFRQAVFHPHSLFAKISLSVLMLLVVLGSTAVYAANNDHLTPGDTFYPLKKTVENVEQQFSLTKKSQVDTLNKLSERRLKEALNLAQDNLENNVAADSAVISDSIQETINEAVDNLDSAVKTSQKIENKGKAKEAKEQIKKKNEDMIKYLDDIESITKDQDHQVSDKIDEAKKRIKQYNEELDRDESENKKEFRKNHEQVRPTDDQERSNEDSDNSGENDRD